MLKPHHPLHAMQASTPSTPAGLPDALARVAQACEALRLGRPVLLQDDHDREDEADLILPAQGLSVPEMARMIRDGSGIVCLCLTDERCQTLELPPMVAVNNSQYGTGFTVSIEAKTGVTTGVSAADRVRTIQVACDPGSVAADLARPGHVFPLRAKAGGLRERRGHTEGAIDLMRLAGLQPAVRVWRHRRQSHVSLAWRPVSPAFALCPEDLAQRLIVLLESPAPPADPRMGQ